MPEAARAALLVDGLHLRAFLAAEIADAGPRPLILPWLRRADDRDQQMLSAPAGRALPCLGRPVFQRQDAATMIASVPVV